MKIQILFLFSTLLFSFNLKFVTSSFDQKEKIFDVLFKDRIFSNKSEAKADTDLKMFKERGTFIS